MCSRSLGTIPFLLLSPSLSISFLSFLPISVFPLPVAPLPPTPPDRERKKIFVHCFTEIPTAARAGSGYSQDAVIPPHSPTWAYIGTQVIEHHLLLWVYICREVQLGTELRHFTMWCGYLNMSQTTAPRAKYFLFHVNHARHCGNHRIAFSHCWVKKRKIMPSLLVTLDAWR